MGKSFMSHKCISGEVTFPKCVSSSKHKKFSNKNNSIPPSKINYYMHSLMGIFLGRIHSQYLSHKVMYIMVISALIKMLLVLLIKEMCMKNKYMTAFRKSGHTVKVSGGVCTARGNRSGSVC